MSRILFGTSYLRMDEPCYFLTEQNLLSPDSKARRRYQILQVVRNGDQLTEFRRDLGPANSFKAPEFNAPGGVRNPNTQRIEIVETVGRLLDFAERMREEKLPLPDRQPVDLVAGYHDLPDKRQRQRKKLSLVGPIGRVQRD